MEDVKEEIKRYFEDRFKEEMQDIPYLENLEFKILDEWDMNNLEEDIIVEEIKEISQCEKYPSE